MENERKARLTINRKFVNTEPLTNYGIAAGEIGDADFEVLCYAENGFFMWGLQPGPGPFFIDMEKGRYSLSMGIMGAWPMREETGKWSMVPVEIHLTHDLTVDLTITKEAPQGA